MLAPVRLCGHSYFLLNWSPITTFLFFVFCEMAINSKRENKVVAACHKTRTSFLFYFFFSHSLSWTGRVTTWERDKGITVQSQWMCRKEKMRNDYVLVSFYLCVVLTSLWLPRSGDLVISQDTTQRRKRKIRGPSFSVSLLSFWYSSAITYKFLYVYSLSDVMADGIQKELETLCASLLLIKHWWALKFLLFLYLWCHQCLNKS